MRFARLFYFVGCLGLLLLIAVIFNQDGGAIRSSEASLSDQNLKTSSQTQTDAKLKYVKDEILVKFAEPLSEFSTAENNSLQSVKEKIKVSEIHPIIKGKIFLKSLATTYVVKFDSRYEKEALKEFRKLTNVKSAHRNQLFQIAATPNDTSYASQWGLNTASNYDIDAPAAWDIQTGSSSVNVAVIDTGVDYDHPDLNANIWVNVADPPGNGDEDLNGLVDDYYGWDWVNDDNSPMDDEGHGTHCSGIIAAETNNATGVAGVAGGWGAEGTNIMSLKAFNSAGSGSSSDIVSALNYAVDKNADIVSMSFVAPFAIPEIETAINDAYTAGLTLVAAAGNDDTAPLPYNGYPAKYSNCVAVTATGSSGAKASYANYGSWVDIAAPGSSIYSTVWNNSYTYKSGTSMATPHVAGVAALIKSEYPTLTNTQIRQRLMWSTKNIYAVNAAYATTTGTGLVDADSALGDYNIFPHDVQESFGTSPDLNTGLWKIYPFTCNAGTVTIKVNARADSNGSADDDDLKFTLDDETLANCDWGESKSWDGAALKSGSKTVATSTTLTAGVHYLKFYADETPKINGILIGGTASTVTYLEEQYPNETSSNLNVALWKDADYAFTTTEAGTVRLEVTASCDSNGSGDDDDMKMVLVETAGGDDVVADFGWSGSQGWDGASLNSCSKTVTAEQFLPAGSYKVEIWADATPHLQSVIISGASTNGDLFQTYPTETMPRAQIGLVKEYTFEGNAGLLISVNASCDDEGDDDDLIFALDGAVPAGHDWGELDSFDGAVLNGSSKTVTYAPNVSAGLHKLSFYADETPTINWITINGLAGAPDDLAVIYPNVTGDINLNEQLLVTQAFTPATTGVYISILAQTDDNGASDDDDIRVQIDSTSYDWDLKGDYRQGAVTNVIFEPTVTTEAHTLYIYGDRAPTIFSVCIYEDNENAPILGYSSIDTANNINCSLWKTYTFTATGSTDFEITGKADPNSSDDDDLKIMIDTYDAGWNGSTSLDGAVDKGKWRTFTVNRNLAAGTHTLKIYGDVKPSSFNVTIRPGT